MTDELKVERRSDKPTHFVVITSGWTTPFDTEAEAVAEAKRLTAFDGHASTVYRSVAEFEPVIAAKDAAGV